MTLTTSNFRERLTALVSAAVGAAVASSLVGLSLQGGPRPVVKPIRMSQGVRLQAAPPVAAPTQPVAQVKVPVQTPDAPREKPKKPPVKPATPEAPKPVEPAPPTVQERPAIEASTSPTLTQPTLATAPKTPDASDLPMLPGQAVSSNAAPKPSAPPDDYTPPPQEYLERPGGEVLVLGVLIDSSGKVLKAQVLVPSWDDLKNYTLAIVAKDITLSDVNPPLAAGETRWLEVRYVIPQSKPGLLP